MSSRDDIEIRNDHFIPKYLLKRFADEAGNTWLHTKEQCFSIKNIDNIYCFKALRPSDPNRISVQSFSINSNIPQVDSIKSYNNLDNDIFNTIDNKYGAILHKIIKDPGYNGEPREVFNMLMVQYLRSIDHYYNTRDGDQLAYIMLHLNIERYLEIKDKYLTKEFKKALKCQFYSFGGALPDNPVIIVNKSKEAMSFNPEHKGNNRGIETFLQNINDEFAYMTMRVDPEKIMCVFVGDAPKYIAISQPKNSFIVREKPRMQGA